MLPKSSPEAALLFTKLAVGLASSWPPSQTANKFRILIFDISWYALFALFFEMENFCRNADKQERSVLERNVERCKFVHITYTLGCYLTAVIIICGPLYTSQNFPTDAKYPFEIDHHPIKEIIFLHQALVGLQASAGLTIDCQVALLLWYTGAKYEILTEKLMDIQNDNQLNSCLKKHQEIIKYTEQVKGVVKYLILTIVATTNVVIIFGGLNIVSGMCTMSRHCPQYRAVFVNQQPLIVKAQYIVIVISASTELFICAWPADNLITMFQSQNISQGVYNSNWLSTKPKNRRTIIQCILRSQKPENIHIGSVLPALSLKYYASFLSTSFSYFTTLRATLTDN
ncbi:odorant receptor 30a-like [Polistes fuscatus]|uniref:odorant receptor 30a-like n=1 Tax=Polistes fuscatus TaxID=30207 RepID=UPI001CA98B2D|nr:odorant receptor 30a-like [Polistes fuscatus]